MSVAWDGALPWNVAEEEVAGCGVGRKQARAAWNEVRGFAGACFEGFADG